MVLNESITELLIQWSHGDESALEKLTPLVYDELHRLAQHYLQRERENHTLQATALIHETFLRLLEVPQIEWQNRNHFIGLAANIMRRILVDHARARCASKRGSGEHNLPLSRAENIGSQPNWNLVALHEALEELTKDFPRKGKIVELRFFGGLSHEEIAEVISSEGTKISLRTVERDWEFARAWLYQRLGETKNNEYLT